MKRFLFFMILGSMELQAEGCETTSYNAEKCQQEIETLGTALQQCHTIKSSSEALESTFKTLSPWKTDKWQLHSNLAQKALDNLCSSIDNGVHERNKIVAQGGASLNWGMFFDSEGQLSLQEKCTQVKDRYEKMTQSTSEINVNKLAKINKSYQEIEKYCNNHMFHGK